MVCTAPITYRGTAQLQIDIDNLKAALDGAKPEEVFMPAISPTSDLKSREEVVTSRRSASLCRINGWSRTVSPRRGGIDIYLKV